MSDNVDLPAPALAWMCAALTSLKAIEVFECRPSNWDQMQEWSAASPDYDCVDQWARIRDGLGEWGASAPEVWYAAIGRTEPTAADSETRGSAIFPANPPLMPPKPLPSTKRALLRILNTLDQVIPEARVMVAVLTKSVAAFARHQTLDASSVKELLKNELLNDGLDEAFKKHSELLIRGAPDVVAHLDEFQLTAMMLEADASDQDISDGMALLNAGMMIEDEGLHSIVLQSRQRALRAYQRYQDYVEQLRGNVESKLDDLDGGAVPSPEQMSELETNQTEKGRVLVRFPSPEGLAWEEVTIAFVSNDSIRVSARGVNKRFTFAEIGFKDGRKGDLPDTLWDLLRDMSHHGGALDWDSKISPTKQRGMKASIKRIRTRLKTLMDVDEDPFHPYKSKKAYVARFTLLDESYTATPDEFQDS